MSSISQQYEQWLGFYTSRLFGQVTHWTFALLKSGKLLPTQCLRLPIHLANQALQ
jgi:hypothetical protein